MMIRTLEPPVTFSKTGVKAAREVYFQTTGGTNATELIVSPRWSDEAEKKFAKTMNVHSVFGLPANGFIVAGGRAIVLSLSA